MFVANKLTFKYKVVAKSKHPFHYPIERFYNVYHNALDDYYGLADYQSERPYDDLTIELWKHDDFMDDPELVKTTRKQKNK